MPVIIRLPAADAGVSVRMRRWWNLGWRAATSQGALAIADQGVVSAAGFATGILLGRTCGSAVLGVYSLALSIVLLARCVQNAVIVAPYTVFWSGKTAQRLPLFAGSVLVHQIGLTALTTLAVVALVPWLASKELPAPVIWTLAAVLPLLQWREFARYFELAHVRSAAALMLDAMASLPQIALLACLAWMGRLSVVGTYTILGATSLAVCLGWAWSRRRMFPIRGGRVAADWRQNWIFSRWVLASQLVGYVGPFVIPWLLAIVHGAAATGMLAAANQVVGLANTFVVGLANARCPQAAQAFNTGGAAALRRVLRMTTWLFAGPLALFCVLMFAGGNGLVVLLFGAKFAGCAPVISVLSLTLLVSSMGVAAGNGLWAIHRPHENFAGDLVTLVVTVAALVPLVHPLGVLGAALAGLAGTTAGTAVRCYRLLRLLHELSLSSDT
jgi:O-antigen/teichoic acid export membrane protein